MNFPLLRDPDDTIILATANSAKANVIVTGDLDLLILSEFQGIPILKPIDFINHYFRST
ncbi:MAG: putative toxin-antitoxin system toxin component, PIN family [Trichodesmium sp.]